MVAVDADPAAGCRVRIVEDEIDNAASGVAHRLHNHMRIEQALQHGVEPPPFGLPCRRGAVEFLQNAGIAKRQRGDQTDGRGHDRRQRPPVSPTRHDDCR